MRNKVLILMSTYNGEKYLKEQLDSILKQIDVEINILIRDDGSTDNTIDIIKQYKEENDNIEWYGGKNLGYAKSFWNLLCTSKEYDYYAFCDQDDVWLEDKIVSAVKLIEQENKNKPILYTSDVISINNQKEIITERTFQPRRNVLGIYESFQKSILPGCTFVFNKLAKQLLVQYNGYMESHDWATYAIINMFGIVIYDSNSYIHYRIHDNNVLGKNSKIKDIQIKIKRLTKNSKCTRSNFAKGFYECYKEMIPDEYIESIRNLAFYKENKKYKIELFMDKNFKGVIFKIYVLLNRI